MAYGFKKLSDVAKVENLSETANVLIEENGVIKKTPKTAVGGSIGVNSQEYDMVIRAFFGDEWKSITRIDPSDCVVVYGTYDDLVAKITSDDDCIPKVLFRYQSQDEYMTVQFIMVKYEKGSDYSLVRLIGYLLGPAGYEPIQIILHNGEISDIEFPFSATAPS